MANNRVTQTRNLTNSLFWLFLLQGLSLIILGILVLVNPALLFILVSINLLWAGVTTLLLAWRVRKFHGQVPELFGKA